MSESNSAETKATSASSTVPGSAQLMPVLGLFSATAIVVGGTIGSGIFLKPKAIAAAFLGASNSLGEAEKYVALVLGLWLVCGLVNLCGALTIGELAAMMPHAGGNYVYLREAYGRSWAFLWAWAEFWVIRSGSTAALATFLTITLIDPQNGFLAELGWPLPAAWQLPAELLFPLTAIVGLTVVNVIGTRWGGTVQNLTTLIKAGFVVFLGLLPFLVQPTPIQATGPLPALGTLTIWAALGTTLAGIMWAYDGWGMVTVVAEEIHNPKRNIPRALSGGVLFLILIYVAANVAYHRSMSLETLARVDSPAVALTSQAFGRWSGQIMQSLLMVSAFGALNSNVLVGPRILFAAARDYRSLHWLQRIDPRCGTPALSILALSAWTCLLLILSFLGSHWPRTPATNNLSQAPHATDTIAATAAPVALVKQSQAEAGASAGPSSPESELDPTARTPQPQTPPPTGQPRKRLFDVLTEFSIFGGSLFYLASVVAVFVLRWKQPDAARPYRTWGYPWVPLVFVAFYLFLLSSMVAGSPLESMCGLVLIGLGLPFFWFLQSKTPAAQAGTSAGLSR